MAIAFVPGAHIVLFGAGYVGETVCSQLRDINCKLTRVTRTKEQAARLSAFGAISTDDLPAHGPSLRTAPHLRWVGYLSSTSVYGDAHGSVVNEQTAVAPRSPAGRARVIAEAEWRRATAARVDVLRLAGVYGPRRSALHSVRRGVRAGGSDAVTCRLHIHDAAAAVIAAARRGEGGVYNVADDMPATRGAVFAYAGKLLEAAGECVPVGGKSGGERERWRGSKRVCNWRLKNVLGVVLRFPTYMQGLADVADHMGLEVDFDRIDMGDER